MCKCNRYWMVKAGKWKSEGHKWAMLTVYASSTARAFDEAGIDGEFEIREVRTGRAPVFNEWGRPESVREEFRKLHHQ